MSRAHHVAPDVREALDLIEQLAAYGGGVRVEGARVECDLIDAAPPDAAVVAEVLRGRAPLVAAALAVPPELRERLRLERALEREKAGTRPKRNAPQRRRMEES